MKKTHLPPIFNDENGEVSYGGLTEGTSGELSDTF